MNKGGTEDPVRVAESDVITETKISSKFPLDYNNGHVDTHDPNNLGVDKVYKDENSESYIPLDVAKKTIIGHLNLMSEMKEYYVDIIENIKKSHDNIESYNLDFFKKKYNEFREKCKLMFQYYKDENKKILDSKKKQEDEFNIEKESILVFFILKI